MRLINIFILVMAASLPATGWAAQVRYALDVQVDVQNQRLTGTARIKATEEQALTFSVSNLSKLIVDDKATTPVQEQITVTAQTGQEIVIHYEAKLEDKPEHFVEQDNVFLTGNWYPKPNGLAEYALSVTLPTGFLATSEAEAVSVNQTETMATFNFQFEHPLDSLTLAASKNYVLKTDTYKNIIIEAYFFNKDAHLAEKYIDYTKKYLAMYETRLTPYPYKRFAIVENILPSGYSMPTYTLLGSAIVHLPFIVKISLGHEILHQWFGNSVFVDYDKGNWAEGITNYLADQHFAAIEGKDMAYRKQIMVDYNAYVNDTNVMLVSEFKGSRSRKAQRAIGYGKTAMIFHRLRKLYGDETFFTVLRDFIKKSSFNISSWHDIQLAFEKAIGTNLSGFFSQWVKHRKDIPHFSAAEVELQVVRGKLILSFTTVQHNAPYHLQKLPVTIYTATGKTKRFIEISSDKEKITLELDEPPTKVVIDENYDIMRQLLPSEIPPTLAAVMGKENIIVVMQPSLRELYQPLINALGIDNSTIVAPKDVKFTQLKNKSLIIAGFDTPLVDTLFSQQTIPDDGVRVVVHKNPYNNREIIALLHTKNAAEVQAVARKLSHYGKYSVLAFTGGKNTHKSIAESANGIPLLIRPAPKAIKPDSITTLDDIIPSLIENRVIYLGEIHEKFSHHLNQLMLIKRLHEAGQKIAVGMEMFQVQSQKALDDYMAGYIDEAAFLQQSQYFNNWGFDYNLYKPILDYVKTTCIPLVALNLDKRITKKVVRQGIHGLTASEKQYLPAEMDFSDAPYRQALYQVFLTKQKLYGLEHFEYFLQAQILWGEMMAQSIHQFLVANPDTKLIVLAGNGHLMYQYGIPKRVHRHLNSPFTVILQDESIDKGIGDYVLFTQEIKGKQSFNLGIAIEEQNNQLIITGVGNGTLAQKAGLQAADIITHLEGQEIHVLADLRLALFYTKAGSTVTIQIMRDGQKISKEITFENDE